MKKERKSEKRKKERTPEREGILPLIIGLGGLSESGKSTAGVFLEQRFGIKRMKIRNVVGLMIESDDIIAIDVHTENYAEDPNFWEDFTSFLIQHLRQNDIHNCVLESFRREGLVTALRRSLGKQFAFIFIDAPEKQRAKRQQHKFESYEQALKHIKERDSEKISHGAAALRQVADFVIVNDSSEQKFLETIEKIGRGLIGQTPENNTVFA